MPISITDSEAFLRRFHDSDPGVTARALARGRIEDGRSSYEILADEAATDGSEPSRGAGSRTGVIVDLGCGDGHLLRCLLDRGFSAGRVVGIDLSRGELARAGQCVPGARLICARAQRLPVAERSANWVLSHLAFVLMAPVEPVVAEIARILRPGGGFATVVGGGPRLGDAFELFADLLNRRLSAGASRPPPLGDRRASSETGLAELLAPERGFECLTIRDLSLGLDGSPAAVWRSLSSVYDMAYMAEFEIAQLRASFVQAAGTLADSRGVVPCTMMIRLVTCRRSA
ncbi:MAG: class I SAM-dependent methyltransferase [Myxococcota bacterium]